MQQQDSDLILKKLEELAGSNCSMHSEVWSNFTMDLHSLKLEQQKHTEELFELRETTKEIRTLATTIQKQNFLVEGLIKSLSELKKDNDGLFSKIRKQEDRLNKCPIEKEKLSSEISNIKTTCDARRDEIHNVVEEKVNASNAGQTLFRWLLSIFLLVSMSITAYNIDKTVAVADSVHNLNIQCEKIKEHDVYIDERIKELQEKHR